MRKRKRRTHDPKIALISYGRKWLRAIQDSDFNTAMKARKDAEELFKKHPEYRGEPPFCNKVLYIKWKWLVGWLNENTRKFYKRCQRMGTSPNHIARMENFNPNQNQTLNP